MTTSRRSRIDKAMADLANERTEWIDRAAALRLKEIVRSDSDGHHSTGWDYLRRQIHDAGFSTIIFPLADGKSYNSSTRNFSLYWGMVNRGGAIGVAYGPRQAQLTDDDHTQQAFPVYCYGKLTPVQFYVRDWMQMNLEEAGYVASASPIKDLLATQTEFSTASGHGSYAIENYHHWLDAFEREWPETPEVERVITPTMALPIKRLKFTYVCLQPENQRFKEALEFDHNTDSFPL